MHCSTALFPLDSCNMFSYELCEDDDNGPYKILITITLTTKLMKFQSTSLYYVWTVVLVLDRDIARGISSHGRALALHARGTGIDARILQLK